MFGGDSFLFLYGDVVKVTGLISARKQGSCATWEFREIEQRKQT